MPRPKAVVCLTTVAKKTDAERLARIFLVKHLVACVNIAPGVISHYRWKGKLCRDREFLLIMKTLPACVKKLEKAVKSVHPYELPEFVVFPLIGGSAAYLDWIRKNVSDF